MMKTKHLFPIVLTALALGACSDDNVVPGSENNGGNGGVGTSEAGYVTLRIGLPSVSSAGRANDNFDEGTPQEYAVKDAALLVFEKADDELESQATFIKAYDLKDLKPWVGNGGNVTVSADMTVEVPALQTDGEKRYALVVLNRNNLFVIDQNTGAVTVGQKSVMSFGDFLTAVSCDAGNMTANGYYMANSPLFNTDNNADYTLVNIEGGIYNTETEAQRNPAVDVYVERGMAKVTLANKYSTPDTGIGSGTYKGDKVELLAWGLDVTNKTSKLVRDVVGSEDKGWDYWVGSEVQNATPENGADKGRFMGGRDTDPRRIYWGIDGNYSTDIAVDAVDTYFNRVGNADITFDKFGSENPIYCLENTFDVEHQKQTQTTRVVFKAKYTPESADTDGTFYQVGGGSDIYNTETLKMLVGETIMKAPGLGSEIGIFDIEDNSVSITLPTGNDAVNGGTYIMNGLGGVTYTWYKLSDDAGNWKFVSLDTYEAEIDNSKKMKGTGVEFTEGQLQTIDSYMGAIKYFKGGESYYTAAIKHFGESCPWTNDGSEPAYGTPGTATDAAYLGRYGVLRNNWYELNVTGISGPGSPDVPSLPDEWDDEATQYINVQVNILSWAKRTQDVEL